MSTAQPTDQTFAMFCYLQRERLRRKLTFTRVYRDIDHQEKRDCAIERRGVSGGGGLSYHKRRTSE